MLFRDVQSLTYSMCKKQNLQSILTSCYTPIRLLSQCTTTQNEQPPAGTGPTKLQTTLYTASCHVPSQDYVAHGSTQKLLAVDHCCYYQRIGTVGRQLSRRQSRPAASCSVLLAASCTAAGSEAFTVFNSAADVKGCCCLLHTS